MTTISIDPVIFSDFPDFHRGLVFATGIDNQVMSEELKSQLIEACDNAAKNPADLKTDFRLTAWDDAHRLFGSNPNKFPPAHKALLKRVQKPGNYVPPINAVIAIMNLASISHIIPVGGDDLTALGSQLELKPAQGNELFTPLGQPNVDESPEPGEIVYRDVASNTLMCRRWNWRNGHVSRITESTSSLLMNIDGLGESAEQRTIETRERVAELLAKYCRATVVQSMLSESCPTVEFEE